MRPEGRFARLVRALLFELIGADGSVVAQLGPITDEPFFPTLPFTGEGLKFLYADNTHHANALDHAAVGRTQGINVPTDDVVRRFAVFGPEDPSASGKRAGIMFESDLNLAGGEWVACRASAGDSLLSLFEQTDATNVQARLIANAARLDMLDTSFGPYAQLAAGTAMHLMMDEDLNVVELRRSATNSIRLTDTSVQTFLTGNVRIILNGSGAGTATLERSSAPEEIATEPFVTAAIAAAAPDVQVFTSGGTWTKPAGAVLVEVFLIGGGGGGGGGPARAAGAIGTGGGGGQGGGFHHAAMSAAAFGATAAVAVGAGGTSGPGATVDSTAGTAGGAGGTTSIALAAGSRVLRAGGGAGGAGGGIGAGGGGGDSNGSGSTRGQRGGAGSATGGAGGAGTDFGVAAIASGCAGGGAGGGVTAANVAAAGGVGRYGNGTAVTDAAGGTVPAGTGGAGSATTTGEPGCGGGGGGGGGQATANSNGGNGGAGGIYGGGGGGGGAGTNTGNGGNGGVGGAGIAVIVTYCTE